MGISESIIYEYAKKIFGFAYSKIKNYHDAEDLSQDIILQLCDKRIDFTAIENVDAYIFRICSYTWSNYYRKNKPMWNTHDNVSELDFLQDDENIEESYIQNELYEKLRREVMFLSKTRRDITVMFYYENKSGEEISKALGIPSSTVRWHIRETKNILKERVEMTKQTDIYNPVKLIVGHSGSVINYDMYGLASDIIMQNICWICRERALATEEIARTIGVAAVYLEDKIEKLLYMDYIKTAGRNRYQTNFFICDLDYAIRAAEFKYENAQKVAVPIFNMLKDRILKANKLLTFDGEFNEDFLCVRY